MVAAPFSLSYLSLDSFLGEVGIDLADGPAQSLFGACGENLRLCAADILCPHMGCQGKRHVISEARS